MANLNVSSICTEFPCLPTPKLSSPAEMGIFCTIQICSLFVEDRLLSLMYMQPVISFLLHLLWLKIHMLTDYRNKQSVCIKRFQNFFFFLVVIKGIGDTVWVLLLASRKKPTWMWNGDLWIIEIFHLVAPLSTLKLDYSGKKPLGVASTYLCYLVETEAAIQETHSSERLYQDWCIYIRTEVHY